MAAKDFPSDSPLASLRNLDCSAQALDLRVGALCKAAQLALMSGDAGARKSVYVALSIIMESVSEHSDHANGEAESHGANWVDEAERAVMRALSTSDAKGAREVSHG